MSEIILILDNIRSNYNVGSLLRSADGFGVAQVWTVGLTPHFKTHGDPRLPHVIMRAEKEISKTALGAERLLSQHFETPEQTLTELAVTQTPLVALELSKDAIPLSEYKHNQPRIALVVGNEVSGVDQAFLAASENIVFIPMLGEKESFNVAVSGAIALYALVTPK